MVVNDSIAAVLAVIDFDMSVIMEATKRQKNIAFDWACKIGNITNAHRLYYEHRVKPSKMSMIWAIENHQTHICRFLVEDDIINVEGCVEYAVAFGFLDIVQYFLEEAKLTTDLDDCLLVAAEYGHLEMFKYLIRRGGNPRTSNDDCFYWTCFKNHVDIAKFLIEEIHVPVDVLDNCALMWACMNENLDQIKYLIVKGIPVQLLKRYVGFNNLVFKANLLKDFDFLNLALNHN